MSKVSAVLVTCDLCHLVSAEELLSRAILAGGAVLLACLMLLCIFQFSSVQKR